MRTFYNTTLTRGVQPNSALPTYGRNTSDRSTVAPFYNVLLWRSPTGDPKYARLCLIPFGQCTERVIGEKRVQHTPRRVPTRSLTGN